MGSISENHGSEGRELILGDESSQKAISFQLAQAFYNEITGKSERISEEISKSFILTMDNVEQLHNRIIQSTAQYNVESANASFSVTYWNDSSERFSSIERFKLHAGAKGVAVEEVDISYNLLVILPQTKRPQDYRINIRLMSRTAKVESMKKEIAELPVHIPLYQFESKFTCRISIDFIDVTVANAFMSVIQKWTECLDETKFNGALKTLRRHSGKMPIGCKYGLLALGAFLTHKEISNFFIVQNPESTASFILIAFLFNFLLLKIGAFIGRESERHLDQIYQMSYINFSGADKKLAEGSSSEVRGNVTKSALYILATLIVV